MSGQPKRKLQQIEQLADRCYATAMHGCSVIPRHYLKRDRRKDPRDEIGRYYEGVFTWSLMLCLVCEKLENLLRAKAGLEPRPSRLGKIRDDNPDAEPEELEVQFRRECERVLGGDLTLFDDNERWP